MNIVAEANSPQAKDTSYILHPNTDARMHEADGPTIIEGGKGIYVYDDEGNEYIEGLSGLWSVAVGFGEKKLVDAAAEQMSKLPYYHLFTHKSHNPAIDLAEKLVSLTPPHLQRVFFTNSGSEAIDTTIKLIWYYNNSNGRPEKKKIISRVRAFHGSTIAAGSLTGLSASHKDFDLPIANILHTRCPDFYREAHEGESEQEFASRLSDELESLILEQGPDTVAAFIAEPLMGAGGVIVPPETYWEKIQQVCRKYEVLLVADEIITGFGRLGHMFGCDAYDIKPDIMVVSKQLTSSYIPLAAVIMSDEIYQVVADNSARLGTLGHGFTNTGHPVATAVGLANIGIIEDRCLVQNASDVAPILQNGLRELADHQLVGDVRGTGLIAGVELVADKKVKRSFDPVGKLGSQFFKLAHQQGLIIRALGDTIAVCPPLIINSEQAVELINRLKLTLASTHSWAMENM